MKAVYRGLFIWSIVILILQSLSQISGLAKYKTLSCKILDKEIGEFKECRIKALNRNTNMLQVRFALKKNINNIIIHINLMKKLNGWRPFLYNNLIIDACDFFKNRKKQILANLIYTFGEKYTNFNHTCPYKAGEDIALYNSVIPENDILRKFPIDMGEYGAFTKYYFNNKLVAELNGSTTFSDI